MSTYRHAFINLVHTSHGKGCFDDSNGLDGNFLSESFSLAIHDARDKDVTANTVLFGLLGYYAVCIDGLKTTMTIATLLCQSTIGELWSSLPAA